MAGLTVHAVIDSVQLRLVEFLGTHMLRHGRQGHTYTTRMSLPPYSATLAAAGAALM